MTTQLAFAFGMLTMVSIGMIIGIVVGLVKVYKLERKLEQTNRDIYESIERIWQRLSEVETNFNRRVDETERNMSYEIEHRTNDVHRRIDDTHRQFNINEEELRRTIDSRFDKFENKIKSKSEADRLPVTDMTAIDLVIEKTKGKKQLLND